MSFRSQHQTYAAFCEEFDEDANVVIPHTRKVANVAAKRSKPELVRSHPAADGSSDSGYSSRTAATVGSGESLTSGTESSSFTPLDHTLTSRDIARMKARFESTEKEREKPIRKAKEKIEHQDVEFAPIETMPAPSPRNSSRPVSMQRTTSSKNRRRESGNSRHAPGSCWECDRYHQAAMAGGVDSRNMDPSVYFHPPHGYDVPPSPQGPRYPPIINQEMQPTSPALSHSRPQRSSSHQSQSNRPASFHPGVAPDPSMMYMSMGHQSSYNGHGPPLSSSAYTNSYMHSPYMNSEMNYQQHSPHPSYESSPQPQYERPRAVSMSRPPTDRPRRSSIYGTPVVEHTPPVNKPYPPERLERKPSREKRTRRPSRSYDPDEDYYRMPPPPIPAPKQRQQQPAQVIPIPKRPNPRKTHTTATSTPSAPRPPPFDMANMRDALPPRVGRSSTRDAISPERRPSSHSTSKSRARTSSSYYDPDRRARISVEDGRHRRSSVYGIEQTKTLGQKQREAEEYQASRAPRAAPPLTVDTLKRASRSQRARSDSDSQESRTDSSRESDINTKNGSGVGSKMDDDSVTMIFGGVKIGFSGDQTINLRSGEEGAVELNIEARRPRRYIMGRSDSTSASGRMEIEDVRRVREDYRSDRDSRRSSRSGHSIRGLVE